MNVVLKQQLATMPCSFQFTNTNGGFPRNAIVMYQIESSWKMQLIYPFRKKIIPFFFPESKAVAPRAWLSFVEMARKSAGKKTVTEGVGDAAVQREVDVWTSEMTCVNAILLLRGTASKWIENLLETQANETKDWEVFKASFKNHSII